jgi:hypothetical protein
MSDNIHSDQVTEATVLAKVMELWEKVFMHSNTVLMQAAHYGFERMMSADPNLQDIVNGTAMIEGAMKSLLDSHVDHWDYQRPLHNAIEQMARMRRLLTAVHLNDRDAFDATLQELEKQLVC